MRSECVHEAEQRICFCLLLPAPHCCLQAKVLQDVEEAFIAGLRHTTAKTAGLGADPLP